MSDSVGTTPSRKPLGALRNLSNTPAKGQHGKSNEDGGRLAKREFSKSFPQAHTPGADSGRASKRVRSDPRERLPSTTRVDENGHSVDARAEARENAELQLIRDLKRENEGLRVQVDDLTEEVENTTYALKLVADDFDTMKAENIKLKSLNSQHMELIDSYSDELEKLRRIHVEDTEKSEVSNMKARKDLDNAENYAAHYRVLYEASAKESQRSESESAPRSESHPSRRRSGASSSGGRARPYDRTR
ncbi:hypothetical protein SARC_01166 [Sphaeroforma arctica JP610]|uniref:Uncharacterized protein n=1 Tax=Sphaeroforma arctica JP610 TaxID=667725 RepID=A0A0L0GCR4_9EUKA|nr:hypothetical protein SARC_01166 [Sphaeroforma arctica JP610]KNC86699.1 hypothetical protein SARC_01166 [Sphaeroforma arctica JP610]|eukprot:XP_014160601.1 hypothetical protein SARC_01166 [Sphaeroforma arctica JP610]